MSEKRRGMPRWLKLLIAEELFCLLWDYLKLLDKLGSRRSDDPWWWLWAWFVYQVMSGYPPGELSHWRYDGTMADA